MGSPDETHVEVELVARRLNRARYAKGAFALALLAGALAALAYQFVSSQPELEGIPPGPSQELRRGLTRVSGQPARAQRYATDGLIQIEVDRFPPHLMRALEVVRPIELGGPLRCKEALEVPGVLEEFASFCDDPHAALSRPDDSGGLNDLCNIRGKKRPFPGWYGQAGSNRCYALVLAMWGYAQQRNSGFDFEQRLYYQMFTGDMLFR